VNLKEKRGGKMGGEKIKICGGGGREMGGGNGEGGGGGAAYIPSW